MTDLELYLKNLTAKDEKKAMEAAFYLVNNSDVSLFKLLVEKSDFLFDFIRNNVCNRIEKVVTKENYRNLIKFFDVYSVYYDDLFAKIFLKYANEELTDEMYSLLENGSVSQKSYAAKYFSYVPDTISVDLLSESAFSDDEYLSFNSAEALGQMEDAFSFETTIKKLESEDDFEKLKAVKFFTAYGKNHPFEKIFVALKNSKMPENIAGQIPYMESLLVLMSKEEYKNEVLLVLENILSGLGEILPLSDIFQFELYEMLEKLSNENAQPNDFSGKVSEILLLALAKFTMFIENQEYIFDEDKDTKAEVEAISKLLQSKGDDFWKKQKQFVLAELKQSNDRILSVLPVIKEFVLLDAKDDLLSLLKSNDEILLCEVVSTLNVLNAIDNIDFDMVLERIKNPNIKAVIENIRG